uniref:Tectonic family member 2 n=1 Tax=Poecilia reticulata TaxID=8081 RepID=A0A3P9QE75_POERE
GPKVSAFLLGNTSGISLNLKTVSSAIRVQLTLNQSLHLCGENETSADCCPKPQCVLETLQVSACLGTRPQASLLIQATINARLFPPHAGSDNNTVFANQVYQPLGVCPCDLTSRACDVRCCCDQDCSNEDLKIFASHCLLGPFGGQVSPAPDFQCSVRSAENSQDWFPFLCVTSPPENNPYLGLFYQGDTVAPRPGPSFQEPVVSAPMPFTPYIQGSPVVTSDDKYFTIPQVGCISVTFFAHISNFILYPPCFLIWLIVGDGLCSTDSMKPVVFGENSTSGCLLPIGKENMTQCDLLRLAAHHDPLSLVDVAAMNNNSGVCSDIPFHQRISVWSLTSSLVDGIPQKEIQALEIRLFILSRYIIDLLTGSVLYSRFQINFTEYDCDRNDVCWPELAFPFTRYYTGEPYFLSLAKGMILVFMFVTAAILGTPWRQIRQAWHNV